MGSQPAHAIVSDTIRDLDRAGKLTTPDVPEPASSTPVDPIDDALQESFPASDPPAWIPLVSIAPRVRARLKRGRNVA
jgi:hypothetical protein